MLQDEALELARKLRQTDLGEDTLARFLSEIEGRIAIELHGITDWEDNGLLSVPFPYDRVYWLHLIAMVDFCEGNLELYEASHKEFCRAFEDYAKFCQQHRSR